MAPLKRKILSLFLTIALFATSVSPIIYSFAAETDEAKLKNDLISAWQQLAAEQVDVVELIARPRDYKSQTPTTITSETTVEGVSDITLLGDTYQNKVVAKVQDWNNPYYMTKDPNALALTEYSKVFIYTCGYKANGSTTTLKICTQVNHANASYTDVNGWTKVDIQRKTGSIKFVIESGTELATISYGCVMGERTKSGAPLPANYAEMTLAELIIEAESVDCSGFESADNFKIALLEAKKFFSSSQDIAIFNELVSAWKQLESESVNVVEIIARPSEYNSQAPTAITTETTVAGVSNIALLGDTYQNKVVAKVQAWSKPYNMTKDPNALALTEYSKVFIYTCGYKADGSTTTLKICTQVNNDNSAYTDVNGWTKVNVQRKTGGIKFVIESGTELATISYGCVMGERTKSAAPLPTNYRAMTLAELVGEAEKVDYSQLPSAESFKTALDKANNYLSTDETTLRNKLISVWQKLAAEKVDVVEIIARPSAYESQSPTTITTDTTVEGVSDIALLGDTYQNKVVAKVQAWNNPYNMTKDPNALALTEYSNVFIYTCGYKADGSTTTLKICTQVNNSNNAYTDVNGWTKVNVKKASGSIKFVIESGTNLSTISYGCVMGKRTLSGAALPENYAEMSLIELIVEAEKVEYDKFPSAQDFEKALKNAKNALDSNDALVKLRLVTMWQKLASESKTITENVAYPLPSNRKTADVSIKNTYGLSDAEYESLGGVYAYVDTSSNSSVFFKNINGKDGIGDLSGYESITVFVKTFDENGNVADGSVAFQVNEGSDGSGSAYPWPKSLNPKWIYTIKNTSSVFGDYFNNVKVAKNFKFLRLSGFKYLLVGAFRGNKSVNCEGLPEDYESMDLRTLTRAAMAIDYEGFESSDAFAAALKDAMAFLDVSEVYHNELINELKKLSVSMPIGIEKYAFEELVYFADQIDTTGKDAASFEEKLQVCKDLLAERKQNIIDDLEVLGLEAPANSDELIAEKFVEEILKLDLASVTGDKSELIESINSYYSLTETGIAISKLSVVWSKITDIPENSEFMLPSEWVAKGEEVDTSSADEMVKITFNNALNTLKDLATKGKADFSTLKEYITKANKMNMLDFTDESAKVFKNALSNASLVCNNTARATQNKVDSALSDLYDAWSMLEIYNRTLWLDFLEYYTGENPEASHNSERSDVTYSAVKIDKLHNGINTALKISNQPGGWYPVNHTGVDLENLKSYEYIEFYFRATRDKFTGNALTFQFQARNGVEWYDATLYMASPNICGEWCRIQVPLSIFSKTKNGVANDLKLSEDVGFTANRVRIMSEGGSNNEYEISSLVVVSTTLAQPGVVPEIPKLVIKDRTEEAAKVPQNPFTGVDRNDPWGTEEKAQNADKSIVAGGNCGYNVQWTLDVDGNFVVSGKGNMQDYSSNVPWQAYRNQILAVTIKDGVTSVGAEAFYNCTNLLKVDLADTVTSIGDYAFYNCNKLAFIEVPAATTDIGECAIGMIYNLKDNASVAVKDFGIYGTTGTAAETYANEYGINFFATALGETDYDVEDLTDGETEEIVVLGEGECGSGIKWSFTSDGLLKITGTGKMDDFDDTTPWETHLFDITKVIISDGIERIGNCSFYGCKYLTEVEIPDSVTEIGEYAFYDCNLLEFVKVPANATLSSIAFGFVYDKENNNFAKTPNFKMEVAGGSPAHKYAKDNGLAYTFYTGSEEDLNSNNSSQSVDNVNNNYYWIWIIAAAGVLLITSGITVFVILRKRKQTKKVSEV